jgi:hypothetical protein
MQIEALSRAAPAAGAGAVPASTHAISAIVDVLCTMSCRTQQGFYMRQKLGSNNKLLWFQINQLTTGKHDPSPSKSSLKERKEVE